MVLITLSMASAVKNGKLLARCRYQRTKSNPRFSKNPTAQKKKSSPVRCMVWSSFQGGQGRALLEGILRQAQVSENHLDGSLRRPVGGGGASRGRGAWRREVC